MLTSYSDPIYIGIEIGARGVDSIQKRTSLEVYVTPNPQSLGCMLCAAFTYTECQQTRINIHGILRAQLYVGTTMKQTQVLNSPMYFGWYRNFGCLPSHVVGNVVLS